MVIIFLKIKNQIKNKAIRLEENSNSFNRAETFPIFFFLSRSEITVHEANHFFEVFIVFVTILSLL